MDYTGPARTFAGELPTTILDEVRVRDGHTDVEIDLKAVE